MAAACIIRNRLQALKLAAGFCVYSDSKRFRCLFCHMRQYFRLIRDLCKTLPILYHSCF